jgi:hypothetical protein
MGRFGVPVLKLTDDEIKRAIENGRRRARARKGKGEGS